MVVDEHTLVMSRVLGTGYKLSNNAILRCFHIGARPSVRLDDRSRMSREVHVRFWESARVRSPRATRQPLYRQHQRLAREGITLARATLSNITHRAIALLEPIVDAQLRHILLSRILAIDETPIKAGRKEKGTMRVGWYWPIYGLDDEVAFTFSRSRGSQHLLDTLNGFNGTILPDGHSAYRRYATVVAGTAHAQCWTHTRREFVKSEKDEPEAVDEALELIGALFLVEAHIRDKNMDLA